MSENDYIAEYVKEKMPSIIKTADFQLWKVCRAIGKLCNHVKDVLSDAFNNMDDDEVKKFLDQIICGVYGDEFDDIQMTREGWAEKLKEWGNDIEA